MKKEKVVAIAELDKYLNKINSVFSIPNLADSKIDIKKIKRYYNDSYIGYKYLHSKEGAVHMALNYDGIFDKKGFYAQAEEIGEIIQSSVIVNVLELGCGRGFNSIFLAPKFPNVKFKGIDITEKHLSEAKNKSQHISNLEFCYGDFNNLDFKDASFDLVYVIEAFCHVSDLKKALSEVYRILKPKGHFVLYDGYKEKNYDDVSEILKKAAILTEKSMLVNYFEKIDVWMEIVSEIGFKIKVVSNLSQAIMPNLERCQGWARGYYKYPLLSKIFLKILPKYMLMNSVAGLLMPFTVHHKVHGYYKIILEK